MRASVISPLSQYLWERQYPTSQYPWSGCSLTTVMLPIGSSDQRRVMHQSMVPDAYSPTHPDITLRLSSGSAWASHVTKRATSGSDIQFLYVASASSTRNLLS